MAKNQKNPVNDKEQKETKAEKKNMPNQPELNLGNNGSVNINIYLRKEQKSDAKKVEKFGGIANDKGAAMEGDKEDNEAVLTINIYL